MELIYFPPPLQVILTQVKLLAVVHHVKMHAKYRSLSKPPVDLLFRKKSVLSYYPRVLQSMPECSPEFTLEALFHIVSYPTNTYILLATSKS